MAATSPPSRTPRTDAERPAWFRAFLTDRATRKPSLHTLEAYRHDLDAIAALVVGDPDRIRALTPRSITKDTMRQAFAAYADSHAAASIRRCWSTWNTLCSYLFTADLLRANPMDVVGRPNPAKTLPRSLPPTAAQALLAAIDAPASNKRRTDWPERDRAIVLTALLAGLRAQELRGANIGDLRATDDGGAVLHVRGKGNKDRPVPIEAGLFDVLSTYLATRVLRFPQTRRGRAADTDALPRLPASAPLFVGNDGYPNHPRSLAISHLARLQIGRPGRPPRPRRTRARPATHLCHRTGQHQHQRLQLDETARP